MNNEVSGRDAKRNTDRTETFLHATRLQPVHGPGKKEFSLASASQIAGSGMRNTLQKPFPSSFLQILSKNTSSVSIILDRPTLHPIQTTHLFPVLICKLFRDFFFFHLRSSLPLFSSQRAKQRARPTAYSSPLRPPRAKNLSQFFFLVCICHEQAQSFYNADTHTCAFAHGNRFFYFFFPICGFGFFFFSFLQKMQTKEKQGFQLKVHLFFNMKTLIELVGSPCSSGQQSPLATDRRHLETQELGFI